MSDEAAVVLGLIKGADAALYCVGAFGLVLLVLLAANLAFDVYDHVRGPREW